MSDNPLSNLMKSDKIMSMKYKLSKEENYEATRNGDNFDFKNENGDVISVPANDIENVENFNPDDYNTGGSGILRKRGSFTKKVRRKSNRRRSSFTKKCRRKSNRRRGSFTKKARRKSNRRRSYF